MKIGRITALAAMTLAARATDAAAVRGFGPASCVSVSRSSAGSCVLHTSCEGQDLSNFDFVFDCLGQKGRQPHSLGVGSFDTQEDYDTDLKCQECLPPQSVKGKAKALAKSVSPKQAATHAGESLVVMSESRARLRAPTDENTPKAEWYGPESCVGVWRDDKSKACVMQTDCDKDVQLGVYEFGLVCVAEDEEMTRHIFGMGSFAHKETFNTQIKCEQCLALDEYMDGEKAVGALSKMVKGLKEDMQDVSGGVNKLNKEVFPPKAAGPAAAPAPAPAQAAAAPAAAKPAKFLLSPPGRSVAHAAASTLSDAGRSVAAATANLVSAPPQQVVALVAPSTESAKLADVVPPAPAKHPEVSEESQGPTQVMEHIKQKHSQMVSSSAPAAPAPEASVQDILATAMKNAQDREGGVLGVAKTLLSKAQAAKLQASVKSAKQPSAAQLTAMQMKQQAVQLDGMQYVVTEEKEKASDYDDDEGEHADDDDDDE